MNAFTLVAALVLVAGVGCVSAQPRFSSTKSASLDQFMQDRYRCAQEARGYSSSAYVGPRGGAADGGTAVNRSLFMSCLAARGYYPDRRGALVVPRGAEISVTD